MASQYAHVLAVLEKARGPIPIHVIGARIFARFKVVHAHTAISARIREIRKDLELDGRTILSERAGPRKAHHLYAIGIAPTLSPQRGCKAASKTSRRTRMTGRR